MKDHPVLIGCLIAVFGAFTMVCAIANWDWFMNSRRALLLVRLFGRNGARIFYAVLGLAFVVGGAVVAFQPQT
jgi:hypothetical protein